jgi:hypothetical protein
MCGEQKSRESKTESQTMSTSESAPNSELQRFDKAAGDCRRFLEKNIRGAGHATLTVHFTGGRITLVEKKLAEA